MPETLAATIAKKFIQRRDIKAIQKPDGDYIPDCEWVNVGGQPTRGASRPFMLSDIESHLAGTRTFGHYLIDADNMTKLFAFDIDLEKTGSWCQLPDLSSIAGDISETEYMKLVRTEECNPREAWRDRGHPGRPWFKAQLRSAVEIFSRTIWDLFDGTVPVAAAYSGSKGVHVYALIGTTPAAAAREAAEMVLAATGKFEPFRGKNFYRSIDQSPFSGLPSLSVEIFPKQSSLEGKDLGNLMRLPLGRNVKSPDPTFFIDQTAPLALLVPHRDPIALLESGNPWK